LNYFDTSLIAALYIPEAKSEKIQKLASRAEGVFISSLTEVEFCSAVSRRVRMKELSTSDGKKIINRFREHIRAGYYNILPLASREYELSSGWLAGFRSSLRTLYALHLAAACANDLKLLTCDVRFAAAAEELHIRAELI
jgi:predicted nucleic acid-binding protein